MKRLLGGTRRRGMRENQVFDPCFMQGFLQVAKEVRKIKLLSKIV